MAWRVPTHNPMPKSKLRSHRSRPAKPQDKRFYARKRWRDIRARVLLANPWCRWPGCPEAASDVDHIVPRSEGGTDDEDNLQGLCKHHHGIKTRQESKP